MTHAKNKGYAIPNTDRSSRPAYPVMVVEYLSEGHGSATLTLDELGMIRDCSKPVEWLFGYHREELLCQHVSTLLPQLAEFVLAGNSQVNPRLIFLCHCGHLFQAQDRRGNTFFSRLNFVQLDNFEKGTVRLIIQPSNDDDLQAPLL